MITCNVECSCPICGKSYTVIVPHEGFIKGRNGGRIQDCLPSLSNEDREALITGICGETNVWRRVTTYKLLWDL